MYYFTHLVITECISNFKQCNTFVYNIINIFLGGGWSGKKVLVRGRAHQRRHSREVIKRRWLVNFGKRWVVLACFVGHPSALGRRLSSPSTEAVKGPDLGHVQGGAMYWNIVNRNGINRADISYSSCQNIRRLHNVVPYWTQLEWFSAGLGQKPAHFGLARTRHEEHRVAQSFTLKQLRIYSVVVMTILPVPIPEWQILGWLNLHNTLTTPHRVA